MVFPGPVWKHGEGDVGQESACALRAPNPGGSASAAQGRVAGCIAVPGIPEAIRAGGACRRSSGWGCAQADEARVSE